MPFWAARALPSGSDGTLGDAGLPAACFDLCWRSHVRLLGVRGLRRGGRSRGKSLAKKEPNDLRTNLADSASPKKDRHTVVAVLSPAEVNS
jgi:hypothetical protein